MLCPLLYSCLHTLVSFPFISDLFSSLHLPRRFFCLLLFSCFSSPLLPFSYNPSSFHTCLKYLPSSYAPFVNPRLLVTPPYCFYLPFFLFISFVRFSSLYFLSDCHFLSFISTITLLLSLSFFLFLSLSFFYFLLFLSRLLFLHFLY